MATKESVKSIVLDVLAEHGITGDSAGNLSEDLIDALAGEVLELEDEEKPEEE